MKKKCVAIGFFLLFLTLFSLSASPKSDIEKHFSVTTLNNGSLSGFVNDSMMNPIVGAVVYVFFHGTYKKNFTDSSGYYHITDIPICNCTKEAIACKEGYKGESVFLSIYENTTYDFVLTLLPSSDLYCWGDLTWVDVQPREIVTGEIWVINRGGYDLKWEIAEWPTWGVWDFGSFFPILPPGGLWIVFVNVTAPDQENETFIGQVTVINNENASDVHRINTSLLTGEASGYNVQERIIGIIRNLQVNDTMISFQILIGLGIRIIEYDGGGMVTMLVPYFLTQIQWSEDYLFDGILQSHFVAGILRYHVD